MDKRTSDGRYSSCKRCHRQPGGYRKYMGKYRKELRKNPTPYIAAVVAEAAISSRTSSIHKRKYKSYTDVERKISKVELSRFFEENWDTFMEMFEDWRNSGFQRRLYPSIDRIDSSGHYELVNIRLLPFHENARLGSKKKDASPKVNTI